MRKWKRPSIDDDDDDEGEVEEEEEEKRYIPRPLRVTRFSDFDFEDEDNTKDHVARFNQIQGLIRAGKYKPKDSDPWIAHILYSNLKALGEI